MPALGTPDGLFTQPTRTFEGVAQISAASTRADGRGTLLAEPDIRRVEALEVHERPASIDPKDRSRVERWPAESTKRSRGRYIPAARVGCRSLVLPFLGPSQTAVAILKNVFDSSQLTSVNHAGDTNTFLPTHRFSVSTSR